MARQRKNAGGAGSGSAGGGSGGGGGSSAAIETKSTTSSTSSSNTTASTVDLLDLHSGSASAGTGGKHHTKSKQSQSQRQKSHDPSAAGGGAGGAAGGGAANQATGLISRFFVMRTWHVLLGCVCLAVASYFGYLGYLETRVNTPFDEQRVVAAAAPDTEAEGGESRFWGSYRPGTYFGLKTRDPQSLVMGLMWFVPTRLQGGGEGIRHWCESGDNLRRYGWNQHDGRTFGVQHIEDETIALHTSFVKFPTPAADTERAQFGGDWTARISVAPLPPRHKPQPNQPEELVSLIWYTALDEKTGGELHTDSQTPITGVRGRTPGLGPFTMHIHPVNGSAAILHESYLSTASAGGLHQLRQLVVANFRLVEDVRSPYGQWIALPGDVPGASAHGGDRLAPNFIATMITGRPPFTVDIAYSSTAGLAADAAQRRRPPIGDAYTAALDAKREQFAERFERTFQLQAKGYSPAEVNFAQSALSNMIGGIGYFYGASRVQSQHTPEPVPYWRAPLYSAVPSRSFFPRGFLWDEGFHGLLISAWDADIELDIMAHWMDLMNREGWIPREQILGAEARAKVPEEFVTQRNTAANPPTFFLTLKAMLGTASRPRTLGGRHLRQLERMYPRLQAWFTWFNSTQRGEVAGTYRWRGRAEDSVEELNPKTLTSGLDDYPRASHPTVAERHVDLRAWIGMAAGVMAELARLLERDESRYVETWAYLRDEELLNELHLSPYTGTYADWGLHTDAVQLRKTQQIARAQPRGGGQPQVVQSARKVRVTAKQPELRFVDTQFGYVSLFPFLLEQLSADAQPLARILEQIRDPSVLWTPYGLRSLSKQAPLYMKRNTEQDPPYWRGQIWLNINYMALKALHHYGSVPGPWAERARGIYVELRANVVRNVVLQYERTGFVWEQYSDATGAGSGCKPFTGWSALTVLMMAEQY